MVGAGEGVGLVGGEVSCGAGGRLLGGFGDLPFFGGGHGGRRVEEGGPVDLHFTFFA